MAITYPLTVPTHTGFSSLQIKARTIVGISASIFTGEQQVYPWAGQWHELTIELPTMGQGASSIWAMFFQSLNGPEGTFYMGPSVRKVTGGTKAGTVTVDTGAVANATTLPITGGTGDFAVGDWLQVGLTTAARLHRVIKVNVGSVDVFPRLRSAYTATTSITYTNPVGIFRLAAMPTELYDSAKLCRGFTFNAIESI